MTQQPADPRRPQPFGEYTTPEFWDDDHISAQMLRCHLDPLAEPASRPHAVIERAVGWLVDVLALRRGSRLLDLGCGPGLYATRFAARGVRVLGVDVSRRSLAHARGIAAESGLPAEFRRGNYLTDDLGTGHDAAVLIYEDYCALSPDQRAVLLSRLRDALRPGGRFAFDVTGLPRFAEYRDAVVCEPDLMDGFWAEPPYFGTQETWTYPALHLVLQRYTIRTHTRTRTYANWMQCLSAETVAAELAAAGFELPDLYADLTGGPFDPASTSFAVVTVRR